MTLDRAHHAHAARVYARSIPAVGGTSATHAASPRSAVRLIDIGRETVAACGSHAEPVLACSVLGFGSLSAVAQSVGILTDETFNSNPWLYVCLAAAGLVLHALTQGALAWLGLHGAGAITWPSLATAARAALRQWRTLMCGALTHAVLTFVCVLGFGLLLLSGRPLAGTDSTDLRWLLTSRSLDVVTLGVEHPFTALLAPARGAMLPIDQAAYAYPPYYALSSHHVLGLPDEWVALASLALLITAETLLRFRVVAAMQTTSSTQRVPWGIFAPLRMSVQLVVRYGTLVAASAWGLRLIVSAIQIAGVIVPIMVADRVVLPQLSTLLGAPGLELACRLVGCVGGALVSALLTTFCTLYDARLFVALQSVDRGQRVRSMVL